MVATWLGTVVVKIVENNEIFQEKINKRFEDDFLFFICSYAP